MVLPGDGRSILRIIITIMESPLQSGGFYCLFIKICKFFVKIVLTEKLVSANL